MGNTAGACQLDGAIASADALPGVAAAVAGRAPIIIDSGVRRGIDALKARALGAQAVAIGRAALFGACAGGETGGTSGFGDTHQRIGAGPQAQRCACRRCD